MQLSDLATELIAQVFYSCASIADVTNLAATCSRFRGVYASSRRLQIVGRAAEAEFGPLEDAYQLVTHNSSQPAHVRRAVPLSEPLLRQVVAVGRTARRWEALYPRHKWDDDSDERRLLSATEARSLRRALYRLWLYGAAHHNPAHPRYTRKHALVLRERARLLHRWPSGELAEVEDVRRVVRDVLRRRVCPSNGTVQREFRKRHPNTSHQLCFNLNVHLNYPIAASASPALPSQHFFFQHHSQHRRQHDAAHKFRPTATHEPGFEGWGDDIAHYYVVEDMLKLDPAQVLWLRDNAPLKAQVEAYVRGLGEWFENNGETFGETLDYVIHSRGDDLDEFYSELEDGISGVAKVGWYADR